MLNLPICVYIVLLLSISSAPIPDWYSKQGYFNQSKLGLQSPDQNCFVQTNDTLLIFRPQILDQPTVNITLPNKIEATFFTLNGKGLYVITSQNDTGTLYYFDIKEGNISQNKISYGEFAISQNLYNEISFSSQNKLVVKDGQSTIMILSIFHQNSSLSVVETKDFKDYGSAIVGMQWHPIEKQMLLIGMIGANDTSPGGGLFGFYNTTSKQVKSINRANTYMINMMKNGTLLFQYWQYLDMDSFNFTGAFQIYEYKAGIVRLLEYQSVGISNLVLSSDGKIFGIQWADYSYQGYTGFGIYRQKPSNTSYSQQITQSILISQKQQLEYVFLDNFDNIYELYDQKSGYYNFYKLYGMSLDGNQIYIRDSGYENSRYSRCVDGTFPLNGQCVNCSSSCKACHKSSIQCRTCKNGSYFYNQKCLPCVQKFNGCLTCSSQECLSCNSTASYNQYPQQGKCLCIDQFYPTSDGSQCKNCTQAMVGCLQCTSKNYCTQCDYISNFYIDYGTHSCVCRQKYSLTNGACQYNPSLWDIQLWKLLVGAGGFILVIFLISVCVVCICKKRRYRLRGPIPFLPTQQGKVDPSSLISQNQQSQNFASDNEIIVPNQN